MVALTEGLRRGYFLFSEANRTISREQVVVAQSVSLVAGTVMGIVTATGKWKQLAPAAADGTQNATGFLLENVNATAADISAAVVARQAEVTASDITWPGGITAPQQAAAIAALGVLGLRVRN